jgi:hypothetical protein
MSVSVSPTQDLAHAVTHQQLQAFLAGVAPYFMPAQADTNELQNVHQAFDLQVYPIVRKTQDPSFPDQLADAWIKMTHAHPDINRGMVDYEEYYEVDQATFDHFSVDVDAALEFVQKCRRREMHDRLIVKPGRLRGNPI